MKKFKILTMFITICLIMFGAQSAFAAEMDCIKFTVEKHYDDAFEVLDIVNTERANAGLSSLTMSKDLMESAMKRAAESALYFSHTRPNGTSMSTAVEISYNYLGENIALGYTSSEDVMIGWMNSPGHRENILTSEYASIGVGCTYNNGIYSWVQIFSNRTLNDAVNKGTQTATYAIDIQDTLLNLTFSKSNVELLVGETYKNNAYFVNNESFYSILDISQFIVTNSNPSVATVSSDGTITAKAIGQTTIKINTKTGKTYSYVVNVTKPTIKFSSSYINVDVGDVIYLSDYATISPSNYQSIYSTEITSSNSGVVYVYDSYAALLAQKEGVANIKIKLKNGAYSTITIRVGDAIFADVSTSAWYSEAVKYCYENKIINGTSTSTFSPNQKLTRGMVATMLYSMAGTPTVTTTNKFSDVSSSKYYYKAILWASANKIASGYAGTTKFGPDDYITREQLAIMLANFANYNKKYTASNYGLNKFNDASKVSSWALSSVRWAVKNGIINGSKGNLNPKGTATRAEAATMLYSYCLKFK